MAKKLNTTVHLASSEDGSSRVLGPDSKLTRADVKELEERWGKRASEFLEDDDEDEVDNATGPDIAPDVETPQIKAAVQENEKVRTDAGMAAAAAAAPKK